MIPSLLATFDAPKPISNEMNESIANMRALGSNPALSNLSVKVFDVLPDHSKITRAPL